MSLSLSAAVPAAAFFTGIDWAAASHAVCVVDNAGHVKCQFIIEHSAAGFAGLIRRLAALGEPAGVPVAIERPHGRLVDALLQAGHPVVPVKPTAIKAWRDGEVVSGAKSDPGDALVIAEYLRLRQHKLRVAVPYSAQTLALRTVARSRGDLVEARVAATNQLSALLDSHWPGAKAIFADVQSPIALAFLTRWPTAASAAKVGEKHIAAFCSRHGYSGRRPAAELLARLRAAPAGTAGDVLSQAVRSAVLAQVSLLQALNTGIKDLDKSVRAQAVGTTNQSERNQLYEQAQQYAINSQAGPGRSRPVPAGRPARPRLAAPAAAAPEARPCRTHAGPRARTRRKRTSSARCSPSPAGPATPRRCRAGPTAASARNCHTRPRRHSPTEARPAS